jgi:hypothetical protein
VLGTAGGGLARDLEWGSKGRTSNTQHPTSNIQ